MRQAGYSRLRRGFAAAGALLVVAHIRSHAFAVGQAIREGIPVHGYLHWSLMDNFEWSDGFEPRFGLYRVDYLTQRRTAGRGAAEFRRLAAMVTATTTQEGRPGHER